jgi:hypothetical protein
LDVTSVFENVAKTISMMKKTRKIKYATSTLRSTDETDSVSVISRNYKSKRALIVTMVVSM